MTQLFSTKRKIYFCMRWPLISCSTTYHACTLQVVICTTYNMEYYLYYYTFLCRSMHLIVGVGMVITFGFQEYQKYIVVWGQAILACSGDHTMHCTTYTISRHQNLRAMHSYVSSPPCYPIPSLLHSITHPLPHSSIPSLLHSLTPPLPHSSTPSLPHSSTPSLLHSLTPPFPHSSIPSLLHSLTPPFPHSSTPPLPHSSTPSLLHSLTPPFPHSSITSLVHSPVPNSPNCLSLSWQRLYSCLSTNTLTPTKKPPCYIYITPTKKTPCFIYIYMYRMV